MTTPLKSVVHRPVPPDNEDTPAFDPDRRSLALFVIAGAAAMAILYWAQAVFIPIVLSILISYALEPLVRSHDAHPAAARGRVGPRRSPRWRA